MISMLYCANSGVFDGVLLSLMSASAKSSVPIHAYVLTMDLTHLKQEYLPITEEQTELLNETMQKYNPLNRAERIDATEIFLKQLSLSPNLSTGYTPYTLLRLLADRLDLPDQVLYVDADTMFNGDIGEILNIDISDYELGGAVDYLGKRFIAKDYLNAGVLYLNLKRIRETGLFERALEMCQTKSMVFPDQDAINELVREKRILPEKFNEQHKWKPDTIIQHFSKTIDFLPLFKVINIKPWQIELVWQVLKIHAYDEIYREYQRIREESKNPRFSPRKIAEPMTWRRQIKINRDEVMSYLHQNGGIFR